MISKFLFLIGFACLGLYGFFTVQAYFQQSALEQELYQPLPEKEVPEAEPAEAKPAEGKRLKEGDLFGRIEIPRLKLSVMIMEGDKDKVLRLGGGHVPGFPLAIAGHRDTFFRPLKDIKLNDSIRLTTREGMTEYRVVSTKIVGPKDMSVLEDKPDDMLTLITCYPFYYIGPSPKRFIVEAAKN